MAEIAHQPNVPWIVPLTEWIVPLTESIAANAGDSSLPRLCARNAAIRPTGVRSPLPKDLTLRVSVGTTANVLEHMAGLFPSRPFCKGHAKAVAGKDPMTARLEQRRLHRDRPVAVIAQMTYRSNRVILVHQNKAGAATGLRHIGTMNGIALDAYAFDLSKADLEGEELAFANVLLGSV